MGRIFTAKRRGRRRGDRKPLLVEHYKKDECEKVHGYDEDAYHGQMDIYSGRQYRDSGNRYDDHQVLDGKEDSRRPNGRGREQKQMKLSLQSLPLLVSNTNKHNTSDTVDTNGTNNANSNKKGKASMPSMMKWKKQKKAPITERAKISATNDAASVDCDMIEDIHEDNPSGKAEVGTTETTITTTTTTTTLEPKQRAISSPSAMQQSRVRPTSCDIHVENSTTTITSTIQSTASITRSNTDSSSDTETHQVTSTPMKGQAQTQAQTQEALDITPSASIDTQDCKKTDADGTITIFHATNDSRKKKKRVKNKITITTTDKTDSIASDRMNNDNSSISRSAKEDDRVNEDIELGKFIDNTAIPCPNDETNIAVSGTENGKTLQTRPTTSVSTPATIERSEEKDNSNNLENVINLNEKTDNNIPNQKCGEGGGLVEEIGDSADDAFGDVVNNFLEKLAPINDAFLEQSEKISSKCSSKCSIGTLKTDEIKMRWQPTLQVVEEDLLPTAKLEVNEKGTVQYEDGSNVDDGFVCSDDESLAEFYEGQEAQTGNVKGDTFMSSNHGANDVTCHGSGDDDEDSSDEDSSLCVDDKNGVECIRVADNVVAFNGGKSPPVLSWRATRENVDTINNKKSTAVVLKKMTVGEDSVKSKSARTGPIMQEPKLQKSQTIPISLKGNEHEYISIVNKASTTSMQVVGKGGSTEATDRKDKPSSSTSTKNLRAPACRGDLIYDNCSVSSALMVETTIEGHLDWIQNSNEPKTLDKNDGDNESVVFSNVEIDVQEFYAARTRDKAWASQAPYEKLMEGEKKKLHRGSSTNREARINNCSNGNLDSAPPSPICNKKVLDTTPATPNTQSTTATSPASSINSSSSDGVPGDSRAQRQDPNARQEHVPAAASNSHFHDFRFIPRVVRSHYRAMSWFICGGCNDDFSNVEPINRKEYNLDEQKFWYTVPAYRAGSGYDDVSTLCDDDGSFVT